MKYTGNICHGCNEPFDDNDDVVVCPDCGTPQHRECYEKENRCVCEHLHKTDYAWHGKVNNESPLPIEKPETVSCPNCGYENPKGTPVCKQCGMKFTLFGMNVVDAMHEENKKITNKNSDIPDYNAPFSLGEGEAFEEKSHGDNTASAREVQQLITDVLTGNSQQNEKGDDRLNLGGPFPTNDEIGGVMTNTIGNFIGTNAMTYISKFKKMQNGKKLSFNFAAFFFAPYWFFYRKLYKAGIVAMTVLISSVIVVTPYLNSIISVYEKYLPAIEAGTITDAQFEVFYSEFLSVSTPIAVFSVVSFLIQLIMGFIANPIYKKYVIEHAGRAEHCENKTAAMAYIVKNGGASVLLGGAAYFAYQLITMLISSIL